jgi:DNA-directed RNA polymerase specialized sigma24 family protein
VNTTGFVDDAWGGGGGGVGSGGMIVGVVDVEVRPGYEFVFRREFAAVAKTVFLIVHDRGRAEEIAQDAFVKLLQRWATVSSYERPDAWVRRVAIRMAVRQARRELRRPSIERGVGAGVERVPDVDVAAAVGALAPMQRAAVVLYYWEDRPVAEIAELLGVSESTVKQHLHRGRARVASVLHEEVSEDVR